MSEQHSAENDAGLEKVLADLSHPIEYDATWPDNLPNQCFECNEALPEGDEMCGHNAALVRLVVAAQAAAVPLIRRAILDPGAFVKRGPDHEGNARGERLDQWQDRAIEAALTRVTSPGTGRTESPAQPSEED